MKKRILFIVTYMDTGGISRSLQHFLNWYDTSKFEVDVYAMVHQGAFNGQFNNCTLLPKNMLVEDSVAHLDQQTGLSKVISAFLKTADKVTKYAVQRFLFRRAGRQLLRRKHYDAVVGFSEGLPSLFVSMMNHPNKIGWIHCDYASYMKVGTGRTEEGVYRNLNSVVCVSEYTRSSFVNIYPAMQDKTYAIYNIIDDKMMVEKSKEDVGIPYDKTLFNIVSIGRIDPVKRLSIVPELAKKVMDAGCSFRWYIVGPKGGSPEEYNLLKENVKKYQMEETVLLLGEKTNPYPYIANADLLVNTSISEACPYVVNEAKILGTPVVCTDFGSAKEFIDYGVNGYYEPIEKLANRITWLINNPTELLFLKQNLMSFRFDNQEILNQISKLIN